MITMAAIMINSVIEDTIPAVSPALLDEDTIKVKITRHWNSKHCRQVYGYN